MTADEFRVILSRMNPAEKAAMKKRARAEQMDDEECVYAIGELIWEARFCQVLGVPTQADRVAAATFSAAWYAKLAFWAAVVGAVLTAVALLK